MTLRHRMLSDMKYRILNKDEFAEDIFIPYAGGSRSIKAVVIRERLDPGTQDAGRMLGRKAEIYIANDDTHGVIAVSKGMDTVQMPAREGESTLVEWSVVEIISKDSGAWHLLVQR